MKVIIFKILEKEYGLDVLNVIQVIRQRPITGVPEASDFVEGVIAWRGKIIPLVNMRKKFASSPQAFQQVSRFIITKVKNHNLGIIVDSVTDVLRIDDAIVEAPDEVLKDASYLKGVVKIDQRIIILIDIEKLFSPEEETTLQGVQAQVEIRKKE